LTPENRNKKHDDNEITAETLLANISVEIHSHIEGISIDSKIILVSHSAGCFFAYNYALHHPNRISSIIAIESSNYFRRTRDYVKSVIKNKPNREDWNRIKQTHMDWQSYKSHFDTIAFDNSNNILSIPIIHIIATNHKFDNPKTQAKIEVYYTNYREYLSKWSSNSESRIVEIMDDRDDYRGHFGVLNCIQLRDFI
jgi:hypothetical protein